jgi:hypothetical protein
MEQNAGQKNSPAYRLAALDPKRKSAGGRSLQPTRFFIAERRNDYGWRQLKCGIRCGHYRLPLRPRLAYRLHARLGVRAAVARHSVAALAEADF